MTQITDPVWDDLTPEQQVSWLSGYETQRECPFHFVCDCVLIDGRACDA